jgi:hypothetical protein
MALPLAAIGAGVSALGAAKKLFGGGKKNNLRRAVSELRAFKPTGYLLPQDYRAAELTRGRLTEGVTSEAGHEGAEIGRRYQARGLAGSPAEERTRARLEQQRLLGVQRAGESSEEQLYNVRTGREAFERDKGLAIFGAQAGEAARESARAQAEDGAFWNSLNEFVPTILSSLGGGTSTLPGYQASIDAGPDIAPREPRPIGDTGYTPGGG